MKIKNNLMKLASITAALLVFGACSDEKLDEIGKNPNSPVEVTSNLLVAQAALTTAFETAGVDLAWYSSVFVEQTVGVHGQLEEADKRTGINSSIGDNSWNSIYANSLADLNDIVTICGPGGKEEGNQVALGLAKVLMAYNFSVLTDLWGEVPYTEALQGVAVRTPKFDSQETVYKGIIGLLKEAISDLEIESTANPGSFDLFYGGDADSWIAAANSLLARYYNRLSNISAAYADSVLLVIPDAFASAEGNMVFAQYNTSATGQNPWWQEEADRGHHAVSQTMYDIMESLNDPRITYFFDELASAGTIVPAPPGTALADQGGTIYSRFTGNYLAPDSPQPIITFDEVKFLEAEAYLGKSNQSAALAAYQEGIEAAMAREGISDVDIADYLAQPSVLPAVLTQTHIITQKYIAFWLFNPIEAYNDYRRTRIPTLQNPVGPAPERFPYTSTESAANPNVPNLGSTAKVWWAK